MEYDIFSAARLVSTWTGLYRVSGRKSVGTGAEKLDGVLMGDEGLA
jgi:hypothetical protein